jgi:peptidyl-prolyl cis-trans isomerase C
MLHGCATDAPTSDITEADVRREYDRQVASLAGKEEYLVRHILVGTQARAQAALDRINAGEAFARVAGEVSEDPGSRNEGGNLGWNLPQFFIDEFSNTMTSLKPRGLASTPTRTRFGWHVIEVMAVRPVVVPPYEKVRDRIAQILREKAQKN